MNFEKSVSQVLKICLIAEKFPVMGSTRTHGFIGPVAHGLVKAGHKVSVIAWNNPVEEKKINQNGVKIHFVSQRRSHLTDRLKKKICEKFFQLHSEETFHIIHSLTPMTNQMGAQKKNLGLAMAYDITATKLAELFSIMAMAENNGPSQLKTAYKVTYQFLKNFFTRDRLLLKNADAVFVHSRQEQLALERYYLYPERKTFNIPYGVEIEDLSKDRLPIN